MRWVNPLTAALLLCLMTVPFNATALPTTDDIKSLGVGVWCYELKGQAADAQVMAEQASTYGIGSVRLKAHDGIQVFRHESKVPAIAEAMRAKGIKVLVWGFNYAKHTSDEAAIIIGYLEKPWCNGYVFNTEAPLLNRGEATEELVTLVRQHRDNCPVCQAKLLAFAPYAFPSKHRNLNYRALVENTDFIEPQMYSATMGRSVKNVVQTTYREWLAWEKANGLSKPIVPLGQAYQPGSENPRHRLLPGQITEFGKRTRGYYAVSFYVWPKDQQLWEELGEVVRGRQGAWHSVAKNPQPLPVEGAALAWYERWWSSWWAVYPWVVIALLLLTLGLVVRLTDTVRIRTGVAAGGAAVALLWPYILAGVLIIVTGVICILLVLIIWKQIKLRVKKAPGSNPGS